MKKRKISLVGFSLLETVIAIGIGSFLTTFLLLHLEQTTKTLTTVKNHQTAFSFIQEIDHILSTHHNASMMNDDLGSQNPDTFCQNLIQFPPKTDFTSSNEISPISLNLIGKSDPSGKTNPNIGVLSFIDSEKKMLQIIALSFQKIEDAFVDPTTQKPYFFENGNYYWPFSGILKIQLKNQTSAINLSYGQNTMSYILPVKLTLKSSTQDNFSPFLCDTYMPSAPSSSSQNSSITLDIVDDKLYTYLKINPNLTPVERNQNHVKDPDNTNNAQLIPAGVGDNEIPRYYYECKNKNYPLINKISERDDLDPVAVYFFYSACHCTDYSPFHENNCVNHCDAQGYPVSLSSPENAYHDVYSYTWRDCMEGDGPSLQDLGCAKSFYFHRRKQITCSQAIVSNPVISR